MMIGDEVYKKIEFGMAGGQNVPPLPGRIVYIHPDRRFYSVEFIFPWNGGERRFRESYPLRNRIIAPRCDCLPEVIDERERRAHRPAAGGEKTKHPRGAVAQARKPAHPGGYLPPIKRKK